MKEGMKMPGFTAEASLYKPRRQYTLRVNRGVDGQVVIPQRMDDRYVALDSCLLGCRLNSRTWWSYAQCSWKCGVLF